MNPRLKMKDLEAATGVSREAIHFYLREGLLPQPERPKRNVAYYDDEHVVRIQAIKRLQQERALPLQAIKRMLERFDYQALSTADDLQRFEITMQSHVYGELPAPNQSLTEVCAATGLSRQFLQNLDDAGIICIHGEGDAAELECSDVNIVQLWAQIQALGFAEDKGYDLAYIKRFADAVKPIAEVEVDHFLQQFGQVPGDEAAQMAAQGISAVNELLARLRTRAIMRVLHERATSEGEER